MGLNKARHIVARRAVVLYVENVKGLEELAHHPTLSATRNLDCNRQPALTAGEEIDYKAVVTIFYSPYYYCAR